MPSSLSHAMIAVAACSVVAPRSLLRPFLIVAGTCAILPDVDAFGRPWYGATGDVDFLGGHRAFTHSFFFAALLGLVVAMSTLASSRWRGYRLRLGLLVAFATAAHGPLDMLCDNSLTAGQGVQLFSPFSVERFTAPWHPIRGGNEVFLLLPPLVLFTRLVWHVRRLPWPRRVEEPALSIRDQ